MGPDCASSLPVRYLRLIPKVPTGVSAPLGLPTRRRDCERKRPARRPAAGFVELKREVLQQLRDLHRVEGGAFAELVAADEHVDAPAVGLADVLPDAAGVDVILIR